jgi:hypothetical protein
MPARTHCSTAAAQPARLNTKTLDDLDPAGRAEARAAAIDAATVPAPAAPGQFGAGQVVGAADQVRVDHQAARGLVVGLVLEQVHQAAGHHHVLPQRHRAVLVHHDRGVAAHLHQPLAELLGVADRRGQADQPDGLRQVQDDLLPHGAAEPVGQVVDLVHHHVAQTVQGGRARVEHVAQDLGGHHDDGRVAVDRRVAGEQADVGRAVAGGEVGELLVGQRLDRGGVEALAALGQGQVHRELADHGLAGTGRGADEHAVAGFQGLARGPLERVELERDDGAELGQLWMGAAPTGRRVRVGRGTHRAICHLSRLSHRADTALADRAALAQSACGRQVQRGRPLRTVRRQGRVERGRRRTVRRGDRRPAGHVPVPGRQRLAPVQPNG